MVSLSLVKYGICGIAAWWWVGSVIGANLPRWSLLGAWVSRG